MAGLPTPEARKRRRVPDDISKEFLDALRMDLAEERARKDSLERRGLTLAAAAATSTALLFGLGTNYEGFAQPLFFGILFLGGLAFLSSAFFGWRASALLEYSEWALKDYDRIHEVGWDESAEEFRYYMAASLIDSLRDARAKNNQKAERFEWALRLLLIGAGLVVLELLLVVIDRILI